MCASVYHASPVVLLIRPPMCLPYTLQVNQSWLSCFIAHLLITVELNPGPSCSLNATTKCALIADMIRYHKLDVLAVCES